MENKKDKSVYCDKAINQIPRLLGNLDRNEFSPTYGCFHRDYWLDKTSDFPDAVRQFGVHSLALVYKHPFEKNDYYKNERIRDWCVAGLTFWAKIQHSDGSFDEFYPYERGWVGPTAFTTFTIIEAYNIISDEIDNETKSIILSGIKKAAYFIAKGESEEDHLANHHAMACLAVWKSYELLKEEKLKESYNNLWKNFKSYHNYNEGWSREYDGVDPGYLSATVSFLAKIYKTNPDPEILEVVKKSVEFVSYFVYPNGFYAGSLGSRNTLHFYSHGFEYFAKKIPLAGSIAKKMMYALSENKLVPPEIMSDRYVFYRVPEFLESYLDCHGKLENYPPLPYERNNFKNFFKESRIFVTKNKNTYIIANISKGGVLKVFDTKLSKLVHNDCGLLGELDDNTIVTSQWIDNSYEYEITDSGFIVTGYLNKVPANKLFTPLKNIIFRSVLVLMSWSSSFSHYLKAKIRKTLILGQRKVDIRFKREILIEENKLLLNDEVEILNSSKFKRLLIGGEFFVRYVPQSRYFQSQELGINHEYVDKDSLQKLNQHKVYKSKIKIDFL